MPATNDGAKKMAAQDEIFLTCSFCSALASFCRLAVSVPSRVRAFCRRSRKESAREISRSTWSSTSRRLCWSSDFDLILLEAAPEQLHHGRERMDGALELDDLAGQLVDPPGDRGVAAEELVLDLVDVVLQPRHDGHVVVHHLVHQGVEHSLRAVAQEVGALLQLPPHLGHPAGFGVPDGDDEVLAR